MRVFTSGDRVTLCAVRERVELMHRRLSRLNAEPFMKMAGARIVFRSTELGEVTRNDAVESTFHIHAHAIVDIENKIVDDWNEYASREEEEEDEQRHASPAEDWLLCTLPPSFALSGRAETARGCAELHRAAVGNEPEVPDAPGTLWTAIHR
jgi:hypothetical protein